MNTLLPIIEQIHGARDDRERARILLACPDNVLGKYADVFTAACERARFVAGAELVALRVASHQARRDEHGLLPDWLARDLEAIRSAMARFAAGPEPCAGPEPPASPTDL